LSEEKEEKNFKRFLRGLKVLYKIERAVNNLKKEAL
jgi:hypothetical protein